MVGYDGEKIKDFYWQSEYNRSKVEQISNSLTDHGQRGYIGLKIGLLEKFVLKEETKNGNVIVYVCNQRYHRNMFWIDVS